MNGYKSRADTYGYWLTTQYKIATKYQVRVTEKQATRLVEKQPRRLFKNSLRVKNTTIDSKINAGAGKMSRI